MAGKIGMTSYIGAMILLLFSAMYPAFIVFCGICFFASVMVGSFLIDIWTTK